MYYKNAIKICNVLSGSVEAVDISSTFYKCSDMVIVLLKEMTCTVVHDSPCRLTHYIMPGSSKTNVSVYKALACYFVFNIQYNAGLVATLEFLQR